MTNGYRGRDYYEAWEVQREAKASFWLGFASGCATVLTGIVITAWVVNWF